MPFILRNIKSERVLTGMLVNHYDLTYYGTVYWDTKEEAETEAQAALSKAGEGDREQWEVYEIDESKLKMCNVKLKNDPSYQLYIEDSGRLRTERTNAGS